MQEQTEPTLQTQTVNTPTVSDQDDIASRGIQPVVEQLPYHTPPAQAEAEVTVAQSISQAGPMLAGSKPAQTEQQPAGQGNKKAVVVAVGVSLCICCVVAILGINHKL